MAGKLWLGVLGAEIELDQYGLTFKERDSEISRSGRVANGDLVCDIIAYKKQFSLTWVKMPESTLETLLALYALEETLSLLVERADGTTDSYTVKFQPFARQRTLVRTSYALWDGEALILDEV